MPRPRSAEWLADEIAGLRNQGVTVVVSLLELSEEREPGILEEGPLCRAAGIEFLSFPIGPRTAASLFKGWLPPEGSTRHRVWPS
jgi:hypothetical protein